MAGPTRVHPSRPLAAAVAVLLGPAGPAAAVGTREWIDQLAAPQYVRREAAGRGLVAAGGEAIGPLEQAVGAGDLEVAGRGIDVLRQLLESDDEGLAAAAEESLERLGDRGDGVGRLAASALDFHRLGRSSAARARLEALGARIRERSSLEGRGLEVEIAAGWTGGPADLRQVSGLRRLATVSIRGVPVDAGMLESLGRIEGVERIDLFGTGAGEDEARLLASLLPGARIDVRAGGRLGVTAAALAGPCEVRTVEPGSAADEAGLRSGDVILSVDGTEVATFDDLAERVGARPAGEILRLVVARDGGTADGVPARISIEVRLDAW